MFSVSKKGSNKKDFAVVNSLGELEALSGMRLGATVEQTAYYAGTPFGDNIPRKVEAAAGGIDSVTMADGLSANLYADSVLVDWLGARGDGTTDDSTAIQAAFDSGAKLVNGKPGSTYIAKTLTIPSKLTFDLNGSTLKASATLNGTNSPILTVSADGVTIKGGTFDGNKDNVASGGGGSGGLGQLIGAGELLLSGCSDILITDTTFQNHSSTQIRLDADGTLVRNITIRGNRFFDAGFVATWNFTGHSFYADGWADSRSAGQSYGIIYTDNLHERVSGIKIAGVAPYKTVRDVQISDNIFKYKGGIETTGAMHLTIQGNIIDPNLEVSGISGLASFSPGISVSPAAQTIIADNEVRGFKVVGIEVNMYSISDLYVEDDGIVDEYLSSGTLLDQECYEIIDFQTGDDFSNIATSQATGAVFKATGTTPTTWTNGSELLRLDTGSLARISSGSLVVGATYAVRQFKAGDDFDNVANFNITGGAFLTTGTTPTTWTNSSKLVKQYEYRSASVTVRGNRIYNYSVNLATTDSGLYMAAQAPASWQVDGNTFLNCGMLVYHRAEFSVEQRFDRTWAAQRNASICENTFYSNRAIKNSGFIITEGALVNSSICGNKVQAAEGLETLSMLNSGFLAGCLIKGNRCNRCQLFSNGGITGLTWTEPEKFGGINLVMDNYVLNAPRIYVPTSGAGRKLGITYLGENHTNKVVHQPIIRIGDGFTTVSSAGGASATQSGNSIVLSTGTKTGTDSIVLTKSNLSWRYNYAIGSSGTLNGNLLTGEAFSFFFNLHQIGGSWFVGGTDDTDFWIIFGKDPTTTTPGPVNNTFGFSLEKLTPKIWYQTAADGLVQSSLSNISSSTPFLVPFRLLMGGGGSPVWYAQEGNGSPAGTTNPAPQVACVFPTAFTVSHSTINIELNNVINNANVNSLTVSDMEFSRIW